MASGLVSYRIDQAGKDHTVAENLIKPCIKDVIEYKMHSILVFFSNLEEKATKMIHTIPLLNDTSHEGSIIFEDLEKIVITTLISRILINLSAILSIKQ